VTCWGGIGSRKKRLVALGWFCDVEHEVRTRNTKQMLRLQQAKKAQSPRAVQGDLQDRICFPRACSLSRAHISSARVLQSSLESVSSRRLPTGASQGAARACLPRPHRRRHLCPQAAARLQRERSAFFARSPFTQPFFTQPFSRSPLRAAFCTQPFAYTQPLRTDVTSSVSRCRSTALLVCSSRPLARLPAAGDLPLQTALRPRCSDVSCSGEFGCVCCWFVLGRLSERQRNERWSRSRSRRDARATTVQLATPRGAHYSKFRAVTANVRGSFSRSSSRTGAPR